MLYGKEVIKFWLGSGFLEIAIVNFTSQTLFELLFACGLKDVVSLVIHLCLSSFYFTERFITVLTSYLRRKVYS